VRAASKAPAARPKTLSENSKGAAGVGRMKPGVRAKSAVKAAPAVKARPGAAWRRPRPTARPTGKIARRK
jgi:hypothetical protein